MNIITITITTTIEREGAVFYEGDGFMLGFNPYLKPEENQVFCRTWWIITLSHYCHYYYLCPKLFTLEGQNTTHPSSPKCTNTILVIRVHQNIQKFSEFYSHLKGNFWHFQVPENGTLSAQIQKLRPLFSRQHPPKRWNRCLFYSFTTFGRVIQHISSENRILKTFWYFGAPYWSYSLLKRWKHVGQNLHLLDQAWESGWEPWWVSLSLLHKQPWCYAIKIEIEKRWDLVPLWWGSRRMNN